MHPFFTVEPARDREVGKLERAPSRQVYGDASENR